MYKQMVIASVVITVMCTCATPQGTSRKGTLHIVSFVIIADEHA